MSPSIFTKVPDESPKGAEIEKARRAAAEFGVKPQPTEFKVKEANGELLPEPLLTENPNRFVVFPIQHHDVRSRAALPTPRAPRRKPRPFL
jgi:hypothetical protein